MPQKKQAQKKNITRKKRTKDKKVRGLVPAGVCGGGSLLMDSGMDSVAVQNAVAAGMSKPPVSVPGFPKQYYRIDFTPPSGKLFKPTMTVLNDGGVEKFQFIVDLE
jgi:hypothetical protein